MSIQLPQNERNRQNRPTRNEGKRQTTHDRRLEVIDLQRFPEEKTFSERYKQDDLKEKLKKLYHNKCGYCEQYSESWHVEHYRPKNGGYAWLAYSWDNLLYCCPTCNEHKGSQFEIRGEKAFYIASDLPSIHALGQKYNAHEKPLLLHPEYDLVEDDFVFDENGQILTEQITNERLIYTVSEACKLDRKDLTDRRKEIVVDKLVQDINAVILKNKNNQEVMQTKIQGLIEVFIATSHRETEEFTVFRKYVITHFLQKILLKTLSEIS